MTGQRRRQRDRGAALRAGPKVLEGTGVHSDDERGRRLALNAALDEQVHIHSVDHLELADTAVGAILYILYI